MDFAAQGLGVLECRAISTGGGVKCYMVLRVKGLDCRVGAGWFLTELGLSYIGFSFLI